MTTTIQSELVTTTGRVPTECLSIRGEWGGICPDCGQRMPSLPKPLGREQTVYVRAGLPKVRGSVVASPERLRW